MMARKYLTLKELGAYIGVAPKTLRNWKTSSPEKLPPHIDISFGGKYDKWRFDSEAVDAWMADHNTHEQAVGL